MFPYIRPLLIPILLVQLTISATPDQWTKRSIYQLLTDRFGPTGNDSLPCNTTDRKYCGGTWKGITNRLDYIQGMGFDAIWISPVVENVEETTAYGEAYHGYWGQNIHNLNSHFGTPEDLKELSTALHARGMYLMLDVVVNHMVTVPKHDPSGAVTFDYTTITSFPAESAFHHFCLISDYNNQTDVEQCWLGDEKLPLADLDTENESVVQTLNGWVKDLVQFYNVNGIRIDTAKHVRKDFWPDFLKAARVFSMAEVSSDNATYTSSYTDVFDSVLDYPTYFSLVSAFNTPHGNFSALVEAVIQAQRQYKNGAFYKGSFLENHDQPRFQSLTQDQALVKNAMMWPFVHDGIPILYSGQEQGYTGGSDPDNREALWLTAYDTSKPLVTFVKTLNAARKGAIASNLTFLTTPMTFISQTNDATLVVNKPPLVGLYTNVGNSSSKTTTWRIPDGSAVFNHSEPIVDVLTCKTMKTNSKGGLEVTVESGMPQLLLPVSKLRYSTLCPNLVKNGSPPRFFNDAHWVGFAVILTLFLW